MSREGSIQAGGRVVPLSAHPPLDTPRGPTPIALASGSDTVPATLRGLMDPAVITIFVVAIVIVAAIALGVNRRR